MNKVPIIRKGTIKDYWSNGFAGGLILGIFVFLLSLINNNALTSLYFGLATWAGIIGIWIGIGFTSEEYLKRKLKIKYLTSDKFSFLDKQDFRLHQDLFFEGVYNEFFFRVLPISKWIENGKRRGHTIEYFVIESFYTVDSEPSDNDWEAKLCGDYYIGHVRFANHCAGFIPKDWENPDFKENFEGLIEIFERENLKPLLNTDWKKMHSEMLTEENENDERTKQIFKIGKVDIKYIKPHKKVSR